MAVARMWMAMAICSLLANAQTCADGDADSCPPQAVEDPAVPSSMLQRASVVQRNALDEDTSSAMEEDAESAAEAVLKNDEEDEMGNTTVGEAELETDAEEEMGNSMENEAENAKRAWHLNYRKENPFGWTLTFKAGERMSPKGYLNGTEMVQLTKFKGSVYGGVGFWMNPLHAAGRIYRLDSPTGNWVFDGQPSIWAGKIELLKVIQWTHNEHGSEFRSGPQEVLIGSYCMDFMGEGQCYIASRKPGGGWTERIYYKEKPYRDSYFSARAAVKHTDPTNNMDYLFMTTGQPGIVRGKFNNTYNHKAIFDEKTSSGKFATRHIALTVVNDHVYTGGGSVIRRRTNGANTWKDIFDMASVDSSTVDEAVGGIRGLCTIASPDGRESLYFGWCPNGESKGCMTRIDQDSKDPDKYHHTRESCVPEPARMNLGGDPYITHVIANYNYALPVNNEGTTEYIVGYMMLLWGMSTYQHPISYQIATAGGSRTAYYAGAGYLIRRSATTYESRTPGGPRRCTSEQEPMMVAARSYIDSPWGGQHAGDVYIGGYDCNDFVSYNTAWTVRGSAAAVHTKPVIYDWDRNCATTTTTSGPPTPAPTPAPPTPVPTPAPPTPPPPPAKCGKVAELNPPEDKRSYMSVKGNDANGQGHAQSMLDSPQAWTAGSDTKYAWMKMDLGQVEWLAGTVLQGRKDAAEWVTSYNVSYSPDNVVWNVVPASLPGSKDSDSKISFSLVEPEKARYVKIAAEAWNGHISMRAGVMVCAKAATPPGSISK